MCQEILELLKTHLLPKTKMNEGLVFLQKMRGDYMRYIAEYASGQNKDSAAKGALEAYEEADRKSRECL